MRQSSMTMGATHVFYNVYNNKDTNTVTLSIVDEQLATVRESPMRYSIQKINVITIGDPFDFPVCSECEHLGHFKDGNEDLTLQHLYKHCLANPADRVMYMHSKGSYHPSSHNTIYRQFVMKMFQGVQT